MSRTKLLRTFLILLFTIILALVIAYESCSVQNEESIESMTPTFVMFLKEKPVNRVKTSTTSVEIEQEVISLDSPEETKPLTQQEEIELYIQNAVSHYPSLSTELISAIIWRESRYDPDAKNYNGTCIGLMQLSTKWHTKRAHNLGLTDLYDPYSNILTGCDLLSELLESYTLEMALMVYHGGYSYAEKYQEAGTIDQYTKDILSYVNQLEEVT